MLYRLSLFARLYKEANILYVFLNKEKFIISEETYEYLNQLYILLHKSDFPYLEVPNSVKNNYQIIELAETGVLLTPYRCHQEVDQFYKYLQNPLHAPVDQDNERILSLTSTSQAGPDKKYAPSNVMRSSCRIFDKDLLISTNSLRNILLESYGVTYRDETMPRIAHRPVASAGGFYPLEIFLISRNSEGIFISYSFDKASEKLIKLQENQLHEISNLHIDSSLSQFDAPSWIFLFFDPSFSSSKYGLRSLLYSTLEAGAVSHSICLAAKNNGINSLQYGAYRDAAVQELFKIHYLPLASILLGYENK